MTNCIISLNTIHGDLEFLQLLQTSWKLAAAQHHYVLGIWFPVFHINAFIQYKAGAIFLFANVVFFPG